MKFPNNCLSCSNTQLLAASLETDEEGFKYIAVVVCTAHKNHDIAEKNILAMHNVTGLDVDIKVEAPCN